MPESLTTYLDGRIQMQTREGISQSFAYPKRMDNLRPFGPVRHTHVCHLYRLLLVGRQVHFPRAQNTQEIVSTLLTAINENYN